MCVDGFCFYAECSLVSTSDYICTYVQYVRTYVCMCKFIYVYMCIHTYYASYYVTVVCTYLHICTLNKHTVHTYIHMFMHTYVHTVESPIVDAPKLGQLLYKGHSLRSQNISPYSFNTFWTSQLKTTSLQRTK